MHDAVDAYLDADPLDLPDAALGERIVALERLIRRAQAAQAETVRVFDRRSAADADGAASTRCWLRDRLRLTDRDAGRLVGLARCLPRLPLAAAAFQAGDITAAHMLLLAGNTRRLPGDVVRSGEPFLVDWARRLDPLRFGVVVRRWVATVAPAAFESDTERRYDSRWLAVHRTFDGMTSLQGMFEPEGGAILESALDALVSANPRDDARTRDQQRADALVDLVELARSHSLLPAAAGGSRPEILVHAPAEALAPVLTPAPPPSPVPDAAEPPPATLADGTPLPPAALDRLACDARFRRVLVDAAGVPVDLGRAVRLVPAALRKYLVLRDAGCRYPGCPREAAFCDAHHVVFWRDGGDTSAANLVLLCRYHHHLVHERAHTLALLPDGTVEVTRPDGHVVSERARGPTALPVS